MLGVLCLIVILLHATTAQQTYPDRVRTIFQKPNLYTSSPYYSSSPRYTTTSAYYSGSSSAPSYYTQRNISAKDPYATSTRYTSPYTTSYTSYVSPYYSRTLPSSSYYSRYTTVPNTQPTFNPYGPQRALSAEVGTTGTTATATAAPTTVTDISSVPVTMAQGAGLDPSSAGVAPVGNTEALNKPLASYVVPSRAYTGPSSVPNYASPYTSSYYPSSNYYSSSSTPTLNSQYSSTSNRYSTPTPSVYLRPQYNSALSLVSSSNPFSTTSSYSSRPTSSYYPSYTSSYSSPYSSTGSTVYTPTSPYSPITSTSRYGSSYVPNTAQTSPYGSASSSSTSRPQSFEIKPRVYECSTPSRAPVECEMLRIPRPSNVAGRWTCNSNLLCEWIPSDGSANIIPSQQQQQQQNATQPATSSPEVDQLNPMMAAAPTASATPTGAQAPQQVEMMPLVATPRVMATVGALPQNTIPVASTAALSGADDTGGGNGAAPVGSAPPAAPAVPVTPTAPAAASTPAPEASPATPSRVLLRVPVGTACSSNLECGPTQYCRMSGIGQCALGNTKDARGKCSSRPHFCPALVQIACGCDGLEYENTCHAARAGFNVKSLGKCQVPQ
ncbi:hypothetical protein PAPYR_9313 [Paratrimastix pyriformis]|uniref:Kazal-like domain-containing protein n=1 Tax=Paratrimastix pyriformis TaxID=342808 RepID=A0ABQ8U8M7_9EUKA|nr:hypothetical protein PAPYR_9313 [Paratrimastix pyriformis]